MDVLKEANLYGVQLYEEHKRFVSSFDERWRSDETVMLLLSAIALFTPERPNVLHKEVVKLEQVRVPNEKTAALGDIKQEQQMGT